MKKAAFLPEDQCWHDIKYMLLGLVFGSLTYLQAYPTLVIFQCLPQQVSLSLDQQGKNHLFNLKIQAQIWP